MSDTASTVCIQRLPQGRLTKLPEKGAGKAATVHLQVPQQSPQSGLNYERIEGGKDR